MDLERFKKFSCYTNPGEFRHLYNGLPSSPEGISAVIHAQLIHPVAAHILSIELTEEQKEDERNCPNMVKILAKLQERAPIGLSLDRRPEHRVVNNCRGHALFMASVLKSQGVPARLRCGFASYLPFAFSCDHTVLEAWMDGGWRLMDADATNEFVRSRGYDFDVFDMPYEIFDFGWKAWRRVRGGFDPIEKYGVPGGAHGWPFLHTALIRDMLALFGQEVPVWKCPPFKDLHEEDVHPTLDRIADLMAAPDENLRELEKYYYMSDMSKVQAP